MIATLIATTPKASMQPLAFQGIMAYSRFPQIRDMLLRRFGDDYVLLFGRPEENLADGDIDWYSHVQGDVKKLDDLPEDERKPICETIARMAAEIGNYAQELIDSREPLKITRGNILKLALRYPDASDIYVIGKQPVVTCWGFGPGTPGVEGMNLVRLARSVVQAPPARPATRQAAPEAVKTAPPVTAPVPRSGCLWWLLPLLPLLLILLLLFCSFGSIPALSGISLFHVPGLPYLENNKENDRQIAELENEIASLRPQVEKHAAMCVKPPAAIAEKPAPEIKESLVIPEHAQSMEFLEGRWACDTGLGNSRTGERVRVIFLFDKKGKGSGIVYEKDDRCQGDASARMRDGVLHIEYGELFCGKPNSYAPGVIDCENVQSGKTECRGRNIDNSSWAVDFYREK